MKLLRKKKTKEILPGTTWEELREIKRRQELLRKKLELFYGRKGGR